MKKVIVGMSGGVDSAVTAYLLKAAGFSVTGITLRTWFSAEGEESRCCEIDDARRVAWKIGIPYYAFNCVLALLTVIAAVLVIGLWLLSGIIVTVNV